MRHLLKHLGCCYIVFDKSNSYSIQYTIRCYRNSMALQTSLFYNKYLGYVGKHKKRTSKTLFLSYQNLGIYTMQPQTEPLWDGVIREI